MKKITKENFGSFQNVRQASTSNIPRALGQHGIKRFEYKLHPCIISKNRLKTSRSYDLYSLLIIPK